MNKEAKTITFWSITSLLIIGLVLVVVTYSPTEEPKGDASQAGILSEDDWTIGNPDSKVVFIEYSDFQCPACGAVEPLLKDMLGEFSNHIVFAYRHLPLKSIHKNAELAAKAAEAAGLQGKFWEMHEKLFATQADWSSEDNAAEIFNKYAGEIGLDQAQFIEDLNSAAVQKAVNADLQLAGAAGLQSTPSFFLNGELIDLPRRTDDLRDLIRTAIDDAS
jgi:protein-disulfide isomerase